MPGPRWTNTLVKFGHICVCNTTVQFYADLVLPKWDHTPPCHLRRTRGQERPVTICCVARTSWNLGPLSKQSSLEQRARLPVLSWAPGVFSHLHLPGPTQASLERHSPRECPHLPPPWILTPPPHRGFPGPRVTQGACTTTSCSWAPLFLPWFSHLRPFPWAI